MDAAFIAALVALVLLTAWNVRRLRRNTELNLWEDPVARKGPLRHWSEKEIQRQSERRDKDPAP